MVIGSAHLAAVGREKGTIDPSTDRVLTFYGSPKTTVPPGSPVLSDPVELSVQPLTELAISLYITRDSGYRSSISLDKRPGTYLPLAMRRVKS